MAAPKAEPPTAVAVPVGLPVTSAGMPVRAFNSGLCDCFNDCCSCCAVSFCAPTVVAQLTERVLNPGRHTCVIVGLFLWSGALINVCLQEPPAQGGEDVTVSVGDDIMFHVSGSESSGSESPWYIGAFAGVMSLALFILTCQVRRTIRRRDNIPATVCAGAIDDVLLSCCCLCCVQAQIMRHEGLIGGRYKLTSNDGFAEMV